MATGAIRLVAAGYHQPFHSLCLHSPEVDHSSPANLQVNSDYVVIWPSPYISIGAVARWRLPPIPLHCPQIAHLARGCCSSLPSPVFISPATSPTLSPPPCHVLAALSKIGKVFHSIYIAGDSIISVEQFGICSQCSRLHYSSLGWARENIAYICAG